MENQVTKLLGTKRYDKKFKITKDDQHWIVDNAEQIQDLPLEYLCFDGVTAESILIWLGSFHNLNLKKLAMIRSKISLAVTNAIANLIPNLVTVDLLRCSIQPRELITIMSAIEQSHVQILNLHGCTFKGPEIIALANCISNSQLIELHVRKSTFAFEQNDADVDAILTNPVARSSLKTLDLSESIFDDKALIAIGNCIKNSSIVKLSLFDCIFSNGKIMSIMCAVQKSTVQILDLDNSFFDDNIGDVMRCIENSSITKFEFGHKKRQYNYEEMSTISNSIKGNNLLHGVGFSYTRISDEIMPIICDMIENSTIKTITLWECGLQDVQITSICNSVAKSNVQSVDLSANHFNIDRNSAAAICNLLEHHNLRKLRMVCNDLDESFIESIMDSIKRSELIKIDIENITYFLFQASSYSMSSTYST